MTFCFYCLRDEQNIHVSKSFLSEVKHFLTPIFERTLYKYFDRKILFCECLEPPIPLDNGETMLWRDVCIKLNPIGQPFSFGLSYRSKDGKLIPPYEIPEKGSIEFQIYEFPSEEQLKDIQDSWAEIVGMNKKVINKKFRFKYCEKPGIGSPDIRIRIVSDHPSNELEAVLTEAFNAWNHPTEDFNIHNARPIHDLWLSFSNQKVTVFCVDLGRTAAKGLEFLLDKLNESSLLIKKVIVE